MSTADKILMKSFFECINILDSLGIKYAPIEYVKVNYRARKRWGQCSYYTRTKTASININHLLCDGKHDRALKETLLHELIHSVEGCQNHGKKWSALAKKVSAATGYDITRGATYEQTGVDPPKARYTIRCLKCGEIVGTYERATKVTKNIARYQHAGDCKGKLEVIV